MAHLASGTMGIAPGAHDKGVIHADAGDDFGASCFELIIIRNVSREVGLAAARGEGTRYTEKDALLTSEKLADFYWGGALFIELINSNVRKLISDLDNENTVYEREPTGQIDLVSETCNPN